MAVSSTVAIPAQPGAGLIEFLPLGGDGRVAPLGCYMADVQLAGDASGGLASISLTLDPRYTNLVAFINVRATSTSAAPEFFVDIRSNAAATGVSGVQIVGTMPQSSMAGLGPNASFLWYPPPIYYPGEGHLSLTMVNTDATEVYSLVAEVYCFDIDIRKLTPLYLMQLNVPGVSAPAAI